MTPRPIRFLHRSRTAEIAIDTPAAATRTVLQWLREDAGCMGTKEGCNEGDCGACMVVIGSIDPQGMLKLEPINSCIRFVPSLDGRALFTVEDLAQAGMLHPVQQALVDAHGSQCGFCTPGFVMSMWALWERHQTAGTVPTRQQVADDLSGNLCRCTGYRPIVDAALQMFEGSAADVPTKTTPTTPTTAKPTLTRAPVVAALKALQSQPPLAIDGCFHAPRTLDELAALRAAKPAARLLAGSTDIGLWVTKQTRDVGELIAVGEVAELQRIEVDADVVAVNGNAAAGADGDAPQIRIGAA
ncbi:MAG: 2Fe-2S iron-sulfur cluster-binding protein, partial [Rubrivivax sp.]